MATKFMSRHKKYSPDWLRELRKHFGKDGKPISMRRISKAVRVSHVGWSNWEAKERTPDSCHQLLLDLLAAGTISIPE